MIIKVELYQGKAYALDDQGNVWELVDTMGTPLCEIRRVTKLSHEQLNREMEPQLARFAPR